MASCLSTQSCYWNLIESAGVAIGSLPPNKLFFRKHNFCKHELTISCAHRSKTRIAATEKTQNPIKSPKTLTTLHPQERDTKDRNLELCDKSDGYPTWARSVEDVAGFYNVDVSEGLCTKAVTGQRDIHGWNELDKVQGTPFWKLVLEQFEDTLVQILLAAAGASFLLAFFDSEHVEESGITAFTEPLVILAIVALNGVIGVWQESKAESTLQALKEMQPEYARVLREGDEIVELPARELVPGDIVELRAGDKVPADMRVAYLKSGTVRLQQASLTGESQPVLKQSEAGDEEDIELQQKDNMVFAGTTVSNGSCVCIVTNTGMATEIGKIQAQIQDASLANYDSPLTRKLDEFANLLTKVVGAICVIVWLVNYKYFIAWDPNDGSLLFNFEQATYYFKVAVALAVAAIPEGLPAVITTCLALGTRRMAEENAIVRRLPSVETLGCTTVICSDKTGTLTTNQMSVVQLVALASSENLRYLKVTGTSYDPNDGRVIDMPAGPDANLQTIAEICALCNDAGIVYKGGSYTATGMPTEAALLVLVKKLGVPNQSLEADKCNKRMVDSIKGCLGVCYSWSRKYTRQFTLEFDRP